MRRLPAVSSWQCGEVLYSFSEKQARIICEHQNGMSS